MILDKILSFLSNVNDVIRVFNTFQEGSLILQSGKNVIEIPNRKSPSEVWISIKNGSNIPVCNGDLDKISYTISDNGFILYADVVSDVVQIDWHVFFEDEKG